ncbi:30S ribosomal protein S2 [Candidatus Gracilibacteria bacterium]|nr:30S ribosomal protein S2 [Candidatus Gracilibacteria bacterium]
MDKKQLNLMFDNLLHIGNKTNYWSPRMRDYIYGSVNGIHVINLVKTSEQLELVKKELSALASEGKKILFVATKLQSRDAFVKLAEETGHYYVSEKWVPGLLTNFKTIKRRINTYLQLKRDAENNTFDQLTKKEKAGKLLELEKLDKAFKGLKEMKRVPEVLFVFDTVYETQAVREGNSLGLKVYGVASTNGDDSVVEAIIPANTNATKSSDFIGAELANVLKNIKVKAPVRPATGAKKAPVKKMEEKTAEKKETTKKPAAKKTPAKKTEEK